MTAHWSAFGFPLCAAVIALGAGTSARQDPAFRTNTQLVQLDVRVTDRDGRFLAGLSREDFELLEDGQPQRIAFFSLVNIPGTNQVDRTVGGASATKPGEALEGRTYVMLLDGPAGGPDHVQRMRSVARLFLDEAFGPNDRMAVTFVKGKFPAQDRMTEQAFTTDRRAIEAAVDRLAPETRSVSGSGADSVVNTYRAIEDISEQLGRLVGGRRSVVVWVGGVVPFDPADDFRYVKRAAEIAFAYRDAIRAANRHHVAVYPVDLRGLTDRLSPPQGFGAFRPGEELKRMAALRVVAEDTGGEAVVGTNNYAAMFAQIASDTSTYYLLGYQPAVLRCDGRFHAITVRVRQAGAAVRARRGYFAPEVVCQ